MRVQEGVRRVPGSAFWSNPPALWALFPENQLPQAWFCLPLPHFFPSWNFGNFRIIGENMKIAVWDPKAGLLQLRFGHNARPEIILERSKNQQIFEKACQQYQNCFSEILQKWESELGPKNGLPAFLVEAKIMFRIWLFIYRGPKISNYIPKC